MHHPEYQYLNLMREIIDKGAEQVDAGTGVKTYSLFGRQLRFDLKEGLPLLTTKKVFWKGVLHELYWFASGQSNIKYLVDNNIHIWDDYPYRIYHEKSKQGILSEMTQEEFINKIAEDEEFAKEHGNLTYVYGDMWRNWPAKNGRKIDQLQWMINNVRKDKSTHSALLNVWNPEYLYDMALKEEACRFPICHNMFQINVNNGKLSLQLYQRTADIFLGVPFNIASYALLAMILAQITENELGEFIHTFGDVHIYEDHFEAAREQLSRDPRPFPKVRIDSGIKEIDDFTPDKIELIEYDPHTSIKAALSATGGYVDDTWKKVVQERKQKNN